MAPKKVKYKMTGIFLIILIVLVIAGCVFVDFWYLVKPAKIQINSVELEVSESDIQIVDELKLRLVEDDEYKALVPVTLPENFQVEPTGKINPFDVNNNEQG